MTGTNWAIRAREFLHCNCDYGCSCQFNSRPTKGDCRGLPRNAALQQEAMDLIDHSRPLAD